MSDKRYDVIAMGEGMVEFNQTLPGTRNYLQGFGGDTSNAVIAAARAGVRCAYLSAVGDETFGNLLMKLWRESGIDTALIAIESGAITGLYFVTHHASGHAFSYRRAGSAASKMRLNAMQQAALRSTHWLHYSGISQAISATAREQCAIAVAEAKLSGAKISFDSNLRLKLWSLSEAKLHMLPAIAACDLFLPSWDDVTQISGLSDADRIIEWSHDLGAKWVALKLGADGVLISDGRTRQRLPPLPVQVVDATGAGDCFAGNLLAQLALGQDLFASAAYANAAAALSVQSWGAVDALPYPEQVQRLLAAHQPR